jgi:hypothetical protein
MTTKMQKLSEWTTKQLATAASVGFATLVGWVLFELLKGTELRAIAASAAGAVDFVAYQVASAGPITSMIILPLFGLAILSLGGLAVSRMGS